MAAWQVEKSQPAPIFSPMKTHLHLAAIFALLTLTPAAFIRAAEPGGVFKINPQATYLLIDVNGGDHALDTAPISLQSIGIQAGDFIRFRVFGAYSYGTGYADSSKLTGVVFSSSNVLLAQDQRHRVGGAIPAGTPFFSTNTYYQDQATDIPQDFVFGDGYYGDKERVVQVPAGAQYIFLAVLDGVYLDNSDPNGDYFVSIRTVPPVTVTGRVLNRKIGLGLSGATVLLAGQTTTTGGNGSFKLTNVDLLVGSELEVRADDFLPQRLTVTAGSDAKAVDVGDILLAPDTDKPVVEQVKTYLNGEGVDGGLFLAGFGLVPTLKIRVDWNGCTPGSVEVRVNGHEFATFSGAGPEYSVELPVDSVLQAALMIGNAITVTATAQEPDMVSEPFNQTLVVLPLPAALQSGSKSSFEDKLKVDLSFPVTKPFGTHNLKVFGIMGGEASVAGEFTYNYRSGKWSLEVGPKFNGESTKYSAFKLKLGPLRDVSAEVKGKANGNATLSRGIDVSGLQFSSALSLGGKYPIGSYGPLGLLGPKLTEVFVDSPGLKEAFQAVSMVIWLKPELAGEFSVAAYPTLNFEDFAFTGKTPLEAVYEPTYGKFKVKLYLGGEPSVKFALPGEFFREVRFKAYAGLEAEIWVFKRHMEYVFVNESYPAEALSPPAPLSEGSHVLAAAENETAGWKIMQRPWLDAGGEGFLPREPEAVSAMNEDTTPHAVGSGLDAFVSMGQSTGVSESKAGGAAVAMVVANDPEATVQAAFPLLSNVLPNSEPALAGKGNELMLAYVRDTGAANPVQFTEVAFSYFDGTTWTVPAPIAIDARGQFSPQVVFDGAGNAVVVFERIKDGAFSGTVMADMAALMEIVWSRWDAATQTWSVPQALTNNAYVDFSPKLSGSLADGDLLLTWNENTANQIVGTGIAGAATNLSVMTCRWDSATQTWGSAAALVPNLTGELSESLGARGNKGVYVWSVDMDGDTDNSADAELYYRLYDATTGIWSPAVRHTNDAVADRHAKVVVDAGGNVYAVWSRDGELVMDVNFVGTPSLVRGGEGTPDVADFALTAGPAGHLALVWQEMTENGSDAHYRIYDPLSSTWGLDAFLSRDSDLERSFAPVWDAAGNLTLAYNNVVITKRTVDVAVEGGGTVSVDGVPQPGRVDLLLAKRAIAKDLSVSADGLRAGSTHFLPGEVVPLTAHVFNSGNLAEQNVVVTFYDGDPASGGALIETGIVYGWL